MCIFERDMHSLILLSLRQTKPLMSASECQCCFDLAVSWSLVGSISSGYGVVICWGCSCSAIVDARAASSVLFVGNVLRVYGVATVCQFQICVCVSGLVSLLSVSKFSLCQSSSTMTKSLHSPAGASCQSVIKRQQLCVHIMNSHEIPAMHLHWNTTEI